MKINKQKGEGEIVGLIIFGLIIWGVVSLFSGSSKNDDYGKSSGSVFSNSRDCYVLSPSNPYSAGSGHYAGFEWGESGNSCGGNSNSFIEGCETYESQEEAYSNCLGK